jgi:SSS family solute:Na+ symporter
VDPVVLVALAVYAAALLAVARRGSGRTAVDYLLDGRRLTLPAFVATLVSTWYGGVLGVGEYAYRFGISNWLVMGVPYYLAALLFAFVLAGRVRASAALSIPDQLRAAYGPAAARVGAGLVLLLAVPAAYVLMLGELLELYAGIALPLAVVLGTAFTVAYVAFGGFRAVVRTNEVQFVLMFAAFLVLLPAALWRIGGPAALWSALPAASRAWDGGAGAQYVVVWYFIALQTLVDPTFYQRCYAAESPATARRGILISVGFWVLFDMLTTFSGLAARVLMPDLADPAMAYPELGRLVLPRLANALFAVGLFATVMSTAHSYLFLGAATLGHDVAPELAGRVDERRWTMIGLAAVGTAAVTIALALRSIIGIWHDVGSVVTAALLLPLALSHFPPQWRYAPRAAAPAMLAAAGVCVAWLVAARGGGAYPLGVEPIFPALLVAGLAWLLPRVPRRPPAPRPAPPVAAADPKRTIRSDCGGVRHGAGEGERTVATDRDRTRIDHGDRTVVASPAPAPTSGSENDRTRRLS